MTQFMQMTVALAKNMKTSFKHWPNQLKVTNNIPNYILQLRNRWKVMLRGFHLNGHTLVLPKDANFIPTLILKISPVCIRFPQQIKN